MEDMPAIISAIGAIITTAMGLYMKYNQTTKDKLLDLKIEQWKKSEGERNAKRSHNSAVVYGELWNILHELQADRVYIVQPHPLGNQSMLSVYYEVKRKGVAEMRESIKALKISEFAKFTSELAKAHFIYITSIETQVVDKQAKAIFARGGSKAVTIQKLTDAQDDWIGSIFCEFTHPIDVSESEASETLERGATVIQGILPEYI